MYKQIWLKSTKQGFNHNEGQIGTKFDKFGTFKTDFQNLLILKSPEFFIFGDNLTHFGLKSDIPVSKLQQNMCKQEGKRS